MMLPRLTRARDRMRTPVDAVTWKRAPVAVVACSEAI